jgi:hypothetical protein
MKRGLPLAHSSVKFGGKHLAGAVWRQLEIVDARHDAGQILVAVDAAVVALAPHNGDARLEAVQPARWKRWIARQEAQKQAAFGLIHVLQNLTSQKVTQKLGDKTRAKADLQKPNKRS